MYSKPCTMYLFCLHVVANLLPTILVCCAITSGNNTDRLALISFKTEINQDPFRIFDSWNKTVHFCKWYGVTCNKRHQRVVSLNLASLQLSGSISPAIGNLSFLRTLNLERNKLGGEIPPQVGRLRRLQTLNLQNNTFQGEIPNNISRCSNLVSIILGNNLLEGGIPEDIGMLDKLERFRIGENNITGAIPQSIGNLSSLKVLYASYNKLTGHIPDTLGRMLNLTGICLLMNNLSGNIPYSIFNLSSLQALDLGANRISGSLPSNMHLPNVQFFSVSTNRFIGSIPPSLSNMSNIRMLQLSSNFFRGNVPSLENLNELTLVNVGFNSLGGEDANDLQFLSTLTNATNLERLAFSANNFVGKIPEKFSNLSQTLSKVYLYENQISGSIPTGIGNLVGLESFQAGINALSGTIPLSIGKLQNLKYLELSSNPLSGTIPPVLGNLTNLVTLWMYDTNFTGELPSEIGKCQKLIGLHLGKNRFTGPIPPEILSISSLSIFLVLSDNNFTGNLPMEVGSLKKLSRLEVSNNMLSGEIPSSLGSCTSLETLNLRGNSFSGVIPSTLSFLRGLRQLDLSSNDLSGEIPTFLTSFRLLNILNLSYNDFDGSVPIEGPFKNASRTLLIGNKKLCGGINEMRLPKCDFGTKRFRLNRQTKIVIISLSILFGSTMLVALFFIMRLRTKKNRSTAIFDDRNGLMKVSYQSLLRATNDFSAENLIGEGSFGTVYRGILDDGEGNEKKIVAIKVLKLAESGASKSFIAECEALRSIRHRNLVKVVTACSGIDYRGNDFKALVYELMENGSLEKWLNPTSTSVEQPRQSLSFLKRLDIAIDIASAVEYLHHHCEVPVVHCDLKPGNVLLDGDMTAHVGDFGLAKLLFRGVRPDSTIELSSSIGVRGTVGYAPPENGMGSDVSIYGDIYSYGILLLEIFTGKSPTDDMFNDGLNIHNFVKTSLPEQVRQIVDPILLEEIFNLVETSNSDSNPNIKHTRNEEPILKCLISIFTIGVSCSVDVPIERMKMSDVITQLCSLRNHLLG